ncbi:MAG: hypothetical protein P4M11_14830 [Candidatus Pacebacteria bacterium]|nr:hypothetical protein [Candidatus Paceibacterota bacterium]
MDAANMLGVSPIEEEEHAKESRERGRSLAVPTSKEKIPRRQSLIEPARTPMIKLSPKLGSKGTLKGLRMPTLRQEVTHLRNVLPRQIAAFPALLRETEQHNANVVHLEDCSRISEAVELVDQVWSLIVVLCIVYNYLLFFFYLGIPGTPTGTALACELAAEFILLLDSCVLTYLYSWKYQLLKTLPMTHLTSWSRSEKLALITIWISSYPQHAVNVIAQISPATLSTIPFALLRVLKLLRYPEIWDYFNSLQKVVKGFRATYVKMTQYVLNICMLIHAMTMLCLTVVRIETDPQWLRKYGLEPASSLEIYTEFLLTAVSNMGGMCYGDAQPVTIYEVMIYCIVVYVGSTSFGALFADLANSIYVNNKRSIENRRKLQQIKNFAVIKGLPAKLKHRLRAYYSTMYPEFRMYRKLSFCYF